jgi:chromosomal replication initiation ATPase DnaA
MNAAIAQLLREVPMEDLLAEILRRDRAAIQPVPLAASWAMPALAAVAEEFGISIHELMTRTSREAAVVLPRQFAMAILESLHPERTLQELGELWHLTHAAALHNIRRIADLRDTEAEQSLRWDRLIQAAHEIASRRSARQVISAPERDPA